MPFAYSRMYIPRYSIHGYAIFDSDYCPGNSEKLSDDCKMAIRCMAGRRAELTRCLLKDERLGPGLTCISDKYPSSNPCSQNLKGKKTFNPFILQD